MKITYCFICLILTLFILTIISGKDNNSLYILTGDKVNIRKEPNSKSTSLGQLKINEKVLFIEKSESREKIGNSNEYWYKVKNSNGIIGWVYGQYLKELSNKAIMANSDIIPFWEEDKSGKIPGKITIKCSGIAFKNKAALLGAPMQNRYKCDEYTFSGSEQKLLVDKNFYLKNVDTEKLKYINFDDMVDLYNNYTGSEKKQDVVELTEFDEVPSYSLTPLFISADYLLHIYHLIFMRMVEDIETNKFYPIIKNLTESLLNEAIDKYKNTNDKKLKNIYKNVSMFFAVPSSIMDIPIKDNNIASSITSVINLINKQEGFSILTITGEKEDFSQYKPRGHYNKSEILQKYFKVMIWYGRIYFPMEKPVEGMIITEMLSNKDYLKKWESIYIPTSYLVGKSDDIDFYIYKKGIQKIFGNNYKIKEFPSEEKLKDFVAYVKSFHDPKIISNSIRNNENIPDLKEQKEKSSGFRFMGQRFIPDSYIFTMFTSPRIGSDQSPRNVPKGLDVMAILGSNEAENLLKSEFNSVPKFNEQFNLIKNEFKNYNDDVYSQNIYWIWLDSFRALFVKPSKGLPNFMYSPEWQYRILLTTHGSWAELRHDTILYAKQSYAEMGGPEPETLYYGGQPRIPKGYVEPNPLFFSKLQKLISETDAKLHSAGVLTDEYKQKLKVFKEVTDQLASIAQKEVKNKKIEDTDFLYISNCTKILRSIVLPNNANYIEDQYKKMAVIADVHTDSFSKQVLEVGVGMPKEIYMFVNDSNGARICIGFVYSYYEFLNPMSNRMTDEDWRKKVYDPSSKLYMKNREPDWIKFIPSVN